MKIGNDALIIGVLAGTLMTSAVTMGADDWVDIKNASELRALHSNKTIKGTYWVAYHYADGTMITTDSGGKPQSRTWKMKGNDQVCYKSVELGTGYCWRFQRNVKNKNELLMTQTNGGETKMATVEDGVPKR